MKLSTVRKLYFVVLLGILLLAMIGGGVLAGIASFIIGIPVLRLRGDYLAIVTLAFGEIMKNIIGNLESISKSNSCFGNKLKSFVGNNNERVNVF